MTQSLVSVLYFSNSGGRGGAEEHILTLLRGLDRRRFRPCLVCRPNLAAQISKDVPPDVDLLPLRFEHPAQVAGARRLARILRERQVDVLHSHMFRASLAASPVGWLCRVPVILETPHVRELWRRGWLKSSYFVDRFAARFVDHYVAVSEANARYLATEKRLPGKKIVVIQNGCDVNLFDPGRRPPAGLKQQLGFHEDDPVLVVVARLEPQKGHSTLMRALPEIRQHFPHVRLVCVGDGSLRADLERLVQALGLEGAVRFAGYQADVRDWLALADFTVLPSLYEGLPLVAIESLAAGRAVVATAVDGTAEIVVHERTGLTVPPANPEELSRAICRLIGDHQWRDRLAAAGRDFVVERFSQERQVQQTQALYLDALARSRRTARRFAGSAPFAGGEAKTAEGA